MKSAKTAGEKKKSDQYMGSNLGYRLVATIIGIIGRGAPT
jgi:hypothetical protein